MLASFDVSPAISSAGSRPATREFTREQRQNRRAPSREPKARGAAWTPLASQRAGAWLYQQSRRRRNQVSCLNVKLRRGRTRATYRGILGSAALAGAVALAAAGCAPRRGPAKASTSASHALTLAEAQATYNTYVTASTAAAKQGDAANGLQDRRRRAVGHPPRPVHGPGHHGHAGDAVQLRQAGLLRPGAAELPAVVRGGGPVSTDTGGRLGRPSARSWCSSDSSRAGRGPWTGRRCSISRSPPSRRDSGGYAIASSATTRASCCRRTSWGRPRPPSSTRGRPRRRPR